MDIVHPEIEKYIDHHTSDENEILQKVDRDTHMYELMPRMLSGKVQGKLLSLISKMLRPKYILEVGTFTGYSALCLAEGLQEGGELHTIEINEELIDKNNGVFSRSPFGKNIVQHIGDALKIIPTLKLDFDLVFIDADKANYYNYYQLVIEHLKSGAVILADNVLWSGKVISPVNDKMDKDTAALIEFNDYVQKDNRVENVLLSVRDGLSLIRKK
jgi:predicted O-methyltransferase YrrM